MHPRYKKEEDRKTIRENRTGGEDMEVVLIIAAVCMIISSIVALGVTIACFREMNKEK